MPASVDNTFASPYLCTPARLGFEYVIHSATKYIGGHHDLIGGVVCTSSEGRERLRDVAIDTGGTMNPFEAWLCLRGLMTLALRMDRHGATAMALAEMLEAHEKVERVRYPGLASHPQHEVAVRELRHGFGGMMAIEVAGGVEGGQRFCDALELAWVATSLGGTHTLVGHAASTTHRQMDPDGAARGGHRRRPRAHQRRYRGRRGHPRRRRAGVGEGVSERVRVVCCSEAGRPSTRSAASRPGR